MRNLSIAFLDSISRPVVDRFVTVEAKHWDRKAILLELAGEIGSLAHECQGWDGFKRQHRDLGRLADECSDVLFVLLRLARADGIQLPPDVLPDTSNGARFGNFVLDLLESVAQLRRGPGEETLCAALRKLAGLCELAGIDLASAHEQEMRIATEYLLMAAKHWPAPKPWRHPVAAWRVWRLQRQRAQVAGALTDSRHNESRQSGGRS